MDHFRWLFVDSEIAECTVLALCTCFAKENMFLSGGFQVMRGRVLIVDDHAIIRASGAFSIRSPRLGS
jgi:hypothetical protein